MGSGIAAHVANAGVPVVLLDIVPAKDRAATARHRRRPRSSELLKTDPAPFMDRANARLVTPRQYRGRSRPAEGVRLDRRGGGGEAGRSSTRSTPSSPPSRSPTRSSRSNTSTISLKRLTEGMPADLVRRLRHHAFLQPAALHAPSGDRRTRRRAQRGNPRSRANSPICAGQGVVVWAKDTPGFIANRIGAFWIQSAAVFAADRAA